MIDVTDDGPVRTVAISRPDRRNALRPEDLDALESAVEDAAAPVVYLRGVGPAFCAGADLDVVAGLDEETAPAFARHGQRVLRSIETSPSVVVAGIDGAARGGGVELALACDLRIATPEATFAETGVRLGIFGAWGGTARLPRVVGLSDALDLSLSGRAIDAEEALRIGLVSRIVSRPRAVAEELGAYPADALGEIKERVRDDADRDTQEDAEAEAFGRLIGAHVPEIREDRR